MNLYARASDAKATYVYGMPGGKPRLQVPYGTVFPVAGERVMCAWDRTWYFPVQVGSTIMWASEAGFSIVRKVDPSAKA